MSGRSTCSCRTADDEGPAQADEDADEAEAAEGQDAAGTAAADAAAIRLGALARAPGRAVLPVS